MWLKMGEPQTNIARVYGVDAPVRQKCNASPDELAQLRAVLPPPRAYGPRTIAEAAAHMREHFLV